MRIDERHQGKEAVVRDPQDADFAVALRDVLHEPVDGVPGIGRMIDGRRVLRAAQGPIDDVVPLGAVLAAHVLHDADVAALQDHVEGVVIAVQDRPEVRALGVARELVGVVGRPGQENRRLSAAPFGIRMTVCSLTPSRMGISRPLDVVEAVVRRLELGRDLAREVGVRRRRGRRGRRWARQPKTRERERRRRKEKRRILRRKKHGRPPFVPRVGESWHGREGRGPARRA